MTDFNTQLTGFLAAAQTKVDAYMQANYPETVARGQRTVIEIMDGPKYVRVVKAEYVPGRTEAITKSAYCFVSKETGEVFKAAGWKAPERKNPRSNIFSADFGASGVTHYGAIAKR